MLPAGGRVLDLACGTGRLSRVLREHGRAVVGMDYSPPMAQKTAALGVPTTVGDGFSSPFRDGAFDAAVALRFAFHWAELDPLLAEMRRVVRPGGVIVLDTYSWSPRSAIAIGRERWGGRVYPHSTGLVRRLAQQGGLAVTEAYPCFVFSPYLYRLAPLPMEQVLERLERVVPRSWLCRVFWKLQVT